MAGVFASRGPSHEGRPLLKRLEFDTFVVYTDNETWAASIHPDEALRRYRAWSGLDAKLIVVAMTSTGFTVADPNDAGMLDVVGTPRNPTSSLTSSGAKGPEINFF